jgi:hypothetical protein
MYHPYSILPFLASTILSSSSQVSDEAKAKFQLECGLIFHYYGNDKVAMTHFKESQSLSGLTWNITGALGRKTKFQTFDVAQLVLEASSSNKLTHETASNLPETLALNDDTLLEKTKFIKDTLNQGNLTILDQSILLAYCLDVKNTNPNDGITKEQMWPFVSVWSTTA